MKRPKYDVDSKEFNRAVKTFCKLIMCNSLHRSRYVPFDENEGYQYEHNLELIMPFDCTNRFNGCATMVKGLTKIPCIPMEGCWAWPKQYIYTDGRLLFVEDFSGLWDAKRDVNAYCCLKNRHLQRINFSIQEIFDVITYQRFCKEKARENSIGRAIDDIKQEAVRLYAYSKYDSLKDLTEKRIIARLINKCRYRDAIVHMKAFENGTNEVFASSKNAEHSRIQLRLLGFVA